MQVFDDYDHVAVIEGKPFFLRLWDTGGKEAMRGGERNSFADRNNPRRAIYIMDNMLIRIGKDEYEEFRPVAYRTTDVFLVCFSPASPESFENVKSKV